MEETYIWHDISEVIATFVGQPEKLVRAAKDNRKFLNGAFWIPRTVFPMNVV
jgi:hypothetical protein